MDVFVFSTFLIIGVVMNFAINYAQVKYHIKHIEACLADLNDNIMAIVTSNIEAQQKQNETSWQGIKSREKEIKGQQQKIELLEEQIEIAVESGVNFQVCSPSLGMMGFDKDEWAVPVDICGVAAMYEVALNARTAYFIS